MHIDRGLSPKQKKTRKWRILGIFSRFFVSKKVNLSTSKPVNQFLHPAYLRFRIFYLELLYKIHLRVRYGHDLAYQRSKTYRKYSDKPYSNAINKAVVTSFALSLIFFVLTQSIFPLINPLNPNKAQAGANTKTWTTNGDFHFNKSSYCNQTTHTNVVISGADYTDGTCATADSDSNVSLTSQVSVDNQTINVGTNPYGTAVNSATNKIYVTNFGSSTVSVINGVTNTVTNTIAVGASTSGIAVNSVTNKIYTANGAGTVSVIDGSTNTVTNTITVGTNPVRIAVNSTTNKIYVTNWASNNVSVIDGGTNNVTNTIAVGTNPYGVAVNASTNMIYAANYNSDTVSVINGVTNLVTATVTLSAHPRGVAVNASANKIYAAIFPSNQISIINGATNTVSSSISTGAGPEDISYNSVANKIYVANKTESTITVIDGNATSSSQAKIYVGTTPEGIDVNTATNKIYTSNYGSNNVTVLDGNNNTISADISPLGSGPKSISLNSQTGYAYAAKPGSNNISVINIDTESVSTTVAVGTSPVGVAVNTATNKIYVANSGSNNVSVIDGTSNTVVATVPVGASPWGIAVNPVTNRIFVTNNSSNEISVINGSTDTIVTTVSVGTGPRGIAVNTTTNKIYFALSAANSIAVMNGVDNTVTTTVVVGTSPWGVAVNATTNKIYSTNNTGNSISVINGATNLVTATITPGTGSAPRGISVNASTNKIYVVMGTSYGINVFDGNTNTAAAYIVNQGQDPYDVAIRESLNKIYVANYDLGMNRTGPSGVVVINRVSYLSSGTISSMKIDAGSSQKAKWSSVAWNSASLPSNTSIKFNVRTSDNNSTWSSWSADYIQSTAGSTSGSGTLSATPSRYLEIQTTLATSDGVSTPTLNDFSVSYDTLEAPQNANITLEKQDGSALKKSDGATATAGVAGGYTNEGVIKVSATGLTCTSCGTSTNIRPEVEIQPLGTAFTGTATATATAGNNYVIAGGLSPATGYHIQIRAIDDQGRVSAWASYGANLETDADITVEQTSPTGTISINSGATYTTTTNVTLTISGSDIGGSNLSQMRFSNDGTTWSDWETYSSSKSWTLSSGDGTKNVYVQFKDNAGNTSGSWIQTSAADFNAGVSTPVNHIYINPSGLFRLLKANGEAASLGSECYSGLVIGGYCTSPWINGLASTPMAGKSVYYQTLSSEYTWGPYSSCPTGSGGTQPCQIGLDPSIPSKAALISPQTYPAMDFSTYPAQNACKLIGGRLPNMQELVALYVGRSSYGNNFPLTPHSSMTENDSGTNYVYSFNGGFVDTTMKTNTKSVRCVRDGLAGGPFSDSVEFTSSAKDNLFAQNYSNLSWSASVPSGAGANALRFQVAANNDNATWNFVGPDGTAGTYFTTSGTQIPSSLNGNRYIKYKAYLQTADNTYTPTVYDVAIEATTGTSDSIILDSSAPSAFALSAPADNSWTNSSQPTLSWNPATDGNGIAKYQLYIDGALDRDNISSSSLSTTPQTPLTETTHTWYIKAYDTAGNPTQSTDTRTIGYDATVPLAPQSFSVTNSVSEIALAWNFLNNIGAPIESVKVERIDWINYDAENPTESWGSFGSYHYKTYPADSTGATVSVTDIDPDTQIVQGKQYAYRVAAKDSVNGAYGAVSSVKSGLTQDSIFDQTVENIAVAPCDGVDNCSTNTEIRHKGYETKISWDPAVDTGVGTSHYLVYRSTQDLNAGNFSDPLVRNSYQIVGVLPYQNGQSPVWYDNDANNDSTGDIFYDMNGDQITISDDIKNLTTKTTATDRLDDYGLYYYRVVAVDAMDNKSPVFNESTTAGEYDVLKSHQNGNSGLDAERTPDVSAPDVPTGVNPTATGIDDLGNEPDPTQGMLISWNFSPDNSVRTVTYKLYRAIGDAEGPVTWGGSPVYAGTNTSYQEKGLAADTWYYYRVTAEDPDGNVSDVSDFAGKKTRNSSVPTTPTYVTVRAVKGDPKTNGDVGKKINVQFNGSTIRYSSNHITGYEVYRSETNYSDEATWLTNATKVKEYTGLNYAGYDGAIQYDVQRNFDDTVTNDAITYYYRVRAIGENSEGQTTSSLSSIQTATLYYGWDTTPDITAPDLPAELKVKDIHDDGVAFKRNIVTWARVADPDRNGENDFYEYRIYRSTDGLTWQQICHDGINQVLRSACDARYQNPLYNASQGLGMADNYYMDLIPNDESNQYYYYYVTAVDNAGLDFKYPNGTVINSGFSNESTLALDSGGHVMSVSLNPAIAKPSICNVGSNPCVATPGSNKASLVNVGVSSATIAWTTDQSADSIVEFKKKGSSDAYIGTINRSFGINHEVTIRPLEPNTEYEYRVVSRNYLANDVIASGSDVPTLKTSGFNITMGNISTTTSTAEVNLSTNLDASSVFIEYQLQRQPGDDAQSKTVGASPEDIAKSPREHRVAIAGLRSNRTYTYKVKAISADGFTAYTDFMTFRTRTFDKEQFTIAPNSSNVAERNINATSAQIIWQTSIPTTSHVDYATAPLATNPAIIAAGNDDLTTYHVVVLEGLTPGTKYYYRVWGVDANEQRYTSEESSFTAVLKPKISNFRVKEVKPYQVTVAWETNVETETIINWGTTTKYGEKKGSSDRTKAHELMIKDLLDSTEYHMQITAHDEAGNEVVDEDRVITTPLDTEGPQILGVKTDILPIGADESAATVIVSWQTNKPATTLVQYDEGIIGGRYTQSSIEDKSLNTSHTVIIKDLKPASSYHFKIVSKDRRSNQGVSPDHTFVTPSKEKSILQLILKALEDTFSWTKNINQFFGNIKTRITGK